LLGGGANSNTPPADPLVFMASVTLKQWDSLQFLAVIHRHATSASDEATTDIRNGFHDLPILQ
jgi:hypothetical protein